MSPLRAALLCWTNYVKWGVHSSCLPPQAYGYNLQNSLNKAFKRQSLMDDSQISDLMLPFAYSAYEYGRENI